MQGDPTNVLASSGGGGDAGEFGGGAVAGTEPKTGSNSSDQVDESERLSYGANRWPRQETLALLKIRSDMDSVFRDSSLKGPLWEEVSRKLAHLGYNRCAKKCKEKFENVYKYHKRTKDGRSAKSEGKTYRFFDQLQALENHHQPQSVTAPPPPLQPPKPQTPTTTPLLSNNPPNASHVTVPSPANIFITSQNNNNNNNNNNVNPSNDQPISPMPLSSSQPLINTGSHPNISPNSFQNLTWHLFSSSTSSSTASDEELQSSGGGKRKRKWKNFFEKLTKDVIKKQQVLQNKFLETIEKLEHERAVREETWRAQEMSRINREHEILIQERTTAAAKDAAVIAFLQKISGQQNQNSLQLHSTDFPFSSISTSPVAPPPPPVSAAAPAPVPVPAPPPSQPTAPPSTPPPPSTVALVPAMLSPDLSRKDDGEKGTGMASSSRWPKVEVEALIKLRTNLDSKYLENGPKGPLWEDISSRMKNLGYNRNAKRCKEKWENINKYFKKVKESSKKRPEDSKTCPYFHQLEALYREKPKINPTLSTMEPIMVRPEQQWPLQQENQSAAAATDNNKEINGRDNKFDNSNIEDEEEEDYDEGETEDEDDGGGGSFEVVASKPMGNGV